MPTMQLLDYIESQIAANRLPLVAITLAAVPYANTPIVLALHWHGFVEHQLAAASDAHTFGYEAVPSSALQVNRRWDSLAELDRAAANVAWELGAWDLARREAIGWNRPGAPAREAIDCMTAFGNHPQLLQGQTPFVSDVPDLEDLLDVAGERGYVKWQFRPVHGGLWAEVSIDETLEPGGYRNPPCPVRPVQPQLERPREVVYRFGHSRHVVST
jgi:hypothetical protein